MNQKATALRSAARAEFRGHTDGGCAPLDLVHDDTGSALNDFNAIMWYWPALIEDPEAAVLSLLLAAEIVADPEYDRNGYNTIPAADE